MSNKDETMPARRQTEKRAEGKLEWDDELHAGVFEGYVDGEPQVKWRDRSDMPQPGDKLYVSAAAANAELATLKAENDDLRKALGDAALSATMLHEMSFKNGGLNAVYSGGAAQLLAEALGQQFCESGADNYLEVGFTTNTGVRLLVTLQRCDGKTPATFRHEAEERLAEALAKLDQLSTAGSARQGGNTNDIVGSNFAAPTVHSTTAAEEDIDVSYEIIQNDEIVAGTSGADAFNEILRYAVQYVQDGPLELHKVSRTRIAKLEIPAAAGQQNKGDDHA